MVAWNGFRYFLQALACIAEIAGIVGGAIAISRRRTRLGVLAIAGFLLLGLNLLVNFGLELIEPRAAMNLINILWISPCIATPLGLLGVICLVIAIFSAVPSKKTEPDEIPNE